MHLWVLVVPRQTLYRDWKDAKENEMHQDIEETDSTFGHKGHSIPNTAFESEWSVST